MSLASSVVIIVAVVIELSVVGSIAGVTHRRFPTYVRTKRDLHVFRALRTRSFILRFQRFFSGDAHPSIQSWLVFAFLFRRRVRISRHRLFVVERIDVDAIRRRFCFHSCFFFNHTHTHTILKCTRRNSYSSSSSSVGSFYAVSRSLVLLLLRAPPQPMQRLIEKLESFGEFMVHHH